MSTKKFGIVASMAFALLVVVSPAFAACSLTTMSECDNNGLMSLIVQLLSGTQTQTTTTGATISGIPAGFTFTTNLKQGSTGNDVKYLQILLNSDAATSIGNKGSETTYFGAMTKAAVVKFQNKYASEVLTPYGLTAGTGFFGSASRTKANAMIAAGGSTGTVTTYPAGCTSATGYSSTTGQSCAGGTVTTPVVGGAFSVSLAASNPAASTLVKGQATADLAHYTFSNGTSTPVVVTSVTLNRAGVSADGTLSNVYLFDGATRLTDAASVSSGKITFNATAGIFTIPANSAKVIAVKSDIFNDASVVGQTVGVTLSAITSNGTLSSTLPIAGNISTIASATLAGVTITKENNTASVDPSSDVKVWETKLAVAQRNVQFTRLSLKQISSIDAKDIQNFRLYVDGTQIATTAGLDSNNYITFTFDKTLTTGNRYVKVLADVIGGSSRKIQFSLRNVADIDLKDSEYNVNIAPTLTSATSDEITVASGILTVTKSSTSLSGKVSNNASNVSLAKFDFKAAGEALKITSLKAGFTYTNVSGGENAGGATLRNGKILVNGVQVGSTATLVSTGTTFTPNVIIEAGSTATVEIVADIYDNDGTEAIANTDTIKGQLIAVTGGAEKRVSMGTLDIPGKDDNTVTVSEGALAIQKTSNYSNQNTVAPRTAAKLASWDLVGSATEAINVNTFTISFAATDFSDSDAYSAAEIAAAIKDAYLVYGSTTLPVKSTITETANDWSVSFALAKNETIKVELYANLQSVIAADDTITPSLVVKGVGAESSSTADVGATAGQITTIKAGSITATRDASSASTSLVDDSGSIKTASYKFTTVNDSYTVSEVVITLPATGVTAISSVNLKDGSTTVQSLPASTTVTFSGLSIPVTANTSKTLDVELVLSSIGTGAGTTGADLTVGFSSAKAIPSSTGDEGPITDATVSGNAIYAYRSVPTISILALPSSTLVAGTKTLSKFTIATNGTGAVTWRKMKFNVAKSAEPTITAGTVKLYDSNGTEITGTVVLGGTDLTAASASADGTITFYATAEEQIVDAKTYELKANISGAITTVGGYIQTNIARPSTDYAPSLKAYAYGTAAGTTTLAYSDASAGGTVTANDVRQTAVSKYTTADVTATETVVGHNGAAKISEAYGITGNVVLTLAESATDNQAAAATFTVSGAGETGLTCTTYTGVDGTGLFASGGVFSTIQSVVCTGTGMGLKILNLAVTNDSGEGVSEAGLVISVTKAADYAANTVVGATDSDLNLALTAGVPATASFIWSDASSQGHGMGTTDWTTDFLVKNLPTDTQNLTK
jgi:hypothetical protein